MLLFTYFILFVSVAPLTGRVADGLANVVSTEIIPFFLPQPLYKKYRSIKLISKNAKSIGDARNMLL